MSTYVSLLPNFFSARRRTLGIRLAELAASCGMTLDTVERLEQGRFLPSPSQAYQLALALDVDPVDLGRWAMAELLLHPEFLCEHVVRAAPLTFYL